MMKTIGEKFNIPACIHQNSFLKGNSSDIFIGHIEEHRNLVQLRIDVSKSCLFHPSLRLLTHHVNV